MVEWVEASLSNKQIKPDVALSASAIESIISTVVMEIQGTTVATDTSLLSIGLDSIASVELANALTDQTNMELPPSLVFDHPTIESMASCLSTTTKPDVHATRQDLESEQDSAPQSFKSMLASYMDG
mmetsp:Transcript_32342/g.100073  ORF Transcript_32342/g.100073 Transcript_32342/m.100073 type:complete len:127 (-) Transcript_32342:1047-1427(-)